MPASSIQTSATIYLATLLVPLVVVVVAQLSDALRMINLDAPETALQGDTIQLSCFFSLQNANHRQTSSVTAQKSKFPSDRLQLSVKEVDKQHSEASGESEVLYAIKWYKDEREFFRYLAQDWPRKQWLPTDGVVVDVDKSDNYTVVLKSVSLKTSGSFKCEVSTDAPSFVTKSIERKMLIYSLPNEGPVIEFAKPAMPTSGAKTNTYFLGDQVEVICSAPESKPTTKLDWLINESLNLSSSVPFSSDDHHRPLFEIESHRFVRLPSIASNGSRIGSEAPTTRQHKQASFRQLMSSPITYTTYELYENGTLLATPQQGPEQKDLVSPLVSLVGGSLDQLAEMSTTKLNFTVDANLLQLFSQTKLDISTPQVSKLEANKVSRSLGVSNIEESPSVLLGSDSIARETTISRRDLSNYAKIKAKRSNLDKNRPSSSLTRNTLSAGSSFVTGISGRRKLQPKVGSAITNDNHKLAVIRIRCVARVLHLSMSDEIKVRLANKMRVNGEDPVQMNAQRRQRPNDNGNSGVTRYLEPNYQATILSLIGFMLMMIFQ